MMVTTSAGSKVPALEATPQAARTAVTASVRIPTLTGSVAATVLTLAALPHTDAEPTPWPQRCAAWTTRASWTRLVVAVLARMVLM